MDQAASAAEVESFPALPGRLDADAGRSQRVCVIGANSGAYGLTASPTAFLGHPAPVEVLV